MHAAMSKLKTMQAFEATFDILGKERDVVWGDGEREDNSDSVLAIKGLTFEQAMGVLAQLGGVAGNDAAPAKEPKAKKEKPKEEPKVDATQTAATPIPEPAKEQPALAVVKETPKVEEPKTANKPVDVIDLDGGRDADWNGLDVTEMAKMTALRPLITHMIEKGFETPEKVVKLSAGLRASVPLLAETFEKVNKDEGAFAKRMERAALMVIGARNGTSAEA